MWNPFKRDKTEYIKVPKEWAEELDLLCQEEEWGFHTGNKTRIVVNHASQIRSFIQ